MATIHAKRFPGESEQYRQARDELLRAELDLRRRVEEVAALRRRLPRGGTLPQDYAFEEGGSDLDDRDTVRTVRLSELFADKDVLLLYNFMFGPKMEKPCPMCSSFIDGLNANARHLEQRVALAVVARSPIARIREFARQRGWRRLRLLSSAKNDYNRDYHGEEPDGAQNPMLNVFVRRDGETRHFWASEALFGPSEPGQNQRHLDLLCATPTVRQRTRGRRGRSARLLMLALPPFAAGRQDGARGASRTRPAHTVNEASSSRGGAERSRQRTATPDPARPPAGGGLPAWA
ncbi:MAG: DUF899 domain-containing protein [Deltaproteobacteria bacterium]|nr:MAG: DUF899 domain-containing protein [Deltaproteobacteria bacterium]